MQRWLNRFSLRARLLGGFLAIILLSVGTIALAVLARAHGARAEAELKTENRIAGLTANSKVALLKARQSEKDFLERYSQLGLNEARSRYVTALAVQIAEARQETKAVAQLARASEVEAQARRIDAALEQYQSGFLAVVALCERLGDRDLGLQAGQTHPTF